MKIKASDHPSCPAETAANQQAASISRVERRVAIAATFVNWPETRLLIYLFASTSPNQPVCYWYGEVPITYL